MPSEVHRLHPARSIDFLVTVRDLDSLESSFISPKVYQTTNMYIIRIIVSGSIVAAVMSMAIGEWQKYEGLWAIVFAAAEGGSVVGVNSRLEEDPKLARKYTCN